MQEDDDPVIQEIPVYLSKLLAEKLFVYQYPVRPRAVCSDDNEVVQSRIKPRHQEVRLELSLDTQSPNFNTSKAEMIAWNADGNKNTSSKKEEKKTEEKFFKNELMDTQILESTRAIPDASNYAVAIYHDKELHITPLQGVVYLRPSFGYLDMSDKRAKAEAKEQGEADLSGEEEDEAQQVTVKFARQENERMKRARERSFGFLSKKSAEEPWYHTQFHSSRSERAELERGKLYCASIEEKVEALSLSSHEYMENFFSTEEIKNSSLMSLKLLPLADQVRSVLRETKLLGFWQLAKLLDQASDLPALLRIVQQVAVLVQGNWVVRSDVLYPKDTASQVNGVPSDLVCRARDYLLYLFTQNRFVNRMKLSGVVKLPSEEIKEILEQVSVMKPPNGWELKLPYDKEFIARYPEIVQRQHMWWEAKQKQLSEAFAGTKSRRKSHRDSSASDSDVPGDARHAHRRKANRRESLSSDNESGAEAKMNCIKLPRRTNKQNIAIKVEPMET